MPTAALSLVVVDVCLLLFWCPMLSLNSVYLLPAGGRSSVCPFVSGARLLEVVRVPFAWSACGVPSFLGGGSVCAGVRAKLPLVRLARVVRALLRPTRCIGFHRLGVNRPGGRALDLLVETEEKSKLLSRLLSCPAVLN